MGRKNKLMAFAFLLLLSCLFAGLVSAEESLIGVDDGKSNVILSFVDTLTGEIVDDFYLRVLIDGVEKNYYLGTGETLRLELSEKNYLFEVYADDPESPGVDYYDSFVLEVSGSTVNEVVYLYPGASLRGFVKDELDFTIADAELNVECTGPTPLDYPSKTDNFGSFHLSFIPQGNCFIYGSHNGALAVGELAVSQGEDVYLELSLDDAQIAAQNSFGVWILFVVVALLAFAFVLLFLFYNSKTKGGKREKSSLKEKGVVGQSNLLNSQENGAGQDEGDENLSPKGEAVFAVLRGNERKVIAFLKSQEKPIYFSKIHYKANISKSSLFKALNSLEKRGIVEMFKEGRVKKVTLSAWMKKPTVSEANNGGSTQKGVDEEKGGELSRSSQDI